MNYDELMTMLDIEEPEEFSYFENMADFFENEEEPEREAVYKLMKKVDKNVLAELITGYLDDVCENLPENEPDLFTLLTNIKLSLSGISRQSLRDENKIVVLTDELLRFRQWYSGEKNVHCLGTETGTRETVTVAEAIALARLEKIGEEGYTYDFADVLDYHLDEYIMSFSEIFDDDAYDNDDFMHIDDPRYDDEGDIE